MNIGVPTTFINIIVGKIRFLTLLIDISGKYNLGIQAQSLKSMFDCANTAERRGKPNLSFRVGKLTFSPNSPITIKKCRLSSDTDVL